MRESRKMECRVLVRDTTNPFPDARSRHAFHKQPIWRAGMEFVVWQFAGEPKNAALAFYAHSSIGERSLAFALLMENSEPREPTLRELLAFHDVTAEEFLESAGVTREAIEAWVAKRAAEVSASPS